MFDKDRTGFIERSEMKAILVGMGETMTDEEAEDLIKEAPIDDDGYVDYMAFVKTLFLNL